jgi:geranylgeranyl pyrophosphate synthase
VLEAGFDLKGRVERLGCSLFGGLGAKLAVNLTAPAEELVARPSKLFRARLVRIAFDLTQDALGAAAADVPEERLGSVAAALELLHAGSLIIDDIQDGSPVRRGAASVHLVYGVPRALCTGNWLYFAPLRMLRELGLDVEREAALYRLYHAAVEAAHCGQAIDLSVKVDALPRSEVAAVCRAVATQKTGAITALATACGALLAGGSPAQVEALHAFGESFGVALQELDDAGNARGCVTPAKRYEDLLARRPGAIWAFAAADFDRWRTLEAAVAALPGDEAPLLRWLADTDYFAHARASVRRQLRTSLDRLRPTVAESGGAWLELVEATETLLRAYEV